MTFPSSPLLGLHMNIFRAGIFRRLLKPLLVSIMALQIGACALGSHLQREEVQRIAGSTYVVTGASSGIGRGTALKLGALGANVVLAARRTDMLEEIARNIESTGGRALVVTTDVSEPLEMEKLAQATVSHFGKIDVWINNAGVGVIGRFEEIPLQDHARVIDVNLKGVIYGSHVALRQFRIQGQGTLVNVGSLQSEIPLAYQASYSASKAGVLSLGRALNEEIRLAGLSESVSVATVLPWATDTPFFNHAANYSGGTPRMIAMDDPQKVVDAIVWVSLYPYEELPVGWKASGAYAAHKIAPDISESIAASISHKVQMKDAPPAPPTSGNLHQPVYGSGLIEGDVRNRIQEENRKRQSRQQQSR